MMNINSNDYVFSWSSSFTSFRNGMEACAPMRVTEMEAATQANLTASSNDSFSDNATANAPLKQSPAAVVSIGMTEGAVIKPSPCGADQYAPRLPKVNTTCLIPFS